MILEALYRYYYILWVQGKLPRPGWDAGFGVCFGLELSDDGKVLDLLEYRHSEMRGGKKIMVPSTKIVPIHPGRTSKKSAYFLCDKTSYILGVDEKEKQDWNLQCFQTSRALHHRLLDGVDSPAARAILAYFDSWNPAGAANNEFLREKWKDLMGEQTYLIFCYNGNPVTDDQAICEAWNREYDAVDPDAVIAQCLITGEMGPIAATHPLIRGVKGAEAGAALVSFNNSSSCSHEHEQNYNAPVCKQAAFAYTAALNALLADRDHRRVIGDITMVCWAEHGEESYQDAAMAVLYGEYGGIKDADLASFLDKLVRGEPMDWGDIRLDPEEHFYVLGLASSKGRISVRFFFQDSFGEFLKNISRHYQDIAVVRPSSDQREHITLKTLLKAAVNPKAKDANNKPNYSHMAMDTLRAILNGTPYPATLLNGVELRISADRNVNRARAGIIKGYYLRKQNIPFPREVLQMDLNADSTNVPYTLGRLFYVLEWIQREAYPDLNATIKDKYFSSASRTPAIVFPRLVDLASHHLKVIRREKQQYHTADWLEGKMGTYQVMLGEGYPVRLTLPEKGAFQLGYYFERQNRYSGKNTDGQEQEKDG